MKISILGVNPSVLAEWLELRRATELRIIVISWMGGSACGQMDSICEIVCHAEGTTISSLSKKSFCSPR